MDRKLRATEQRRVIVEELRRSRCHPTANEIYETVRAKLPRISLGTVYRNLEILSESGEIRKLEMAGSQRRFDGTMENHFHVKCLKCDRVSDAELPLVQEILDSLKELDGYEIVLSHLEFSGICPECRKKGTTCLQQAIAEKTAMI